MEAFLPSEFPSTDFRETVINTQKWQLAITGGENNTDPALTYKQRGCFGKKNFLQNFSTVCFVVYSQRFCVGSILVYLNLSEKPVPVKKQKYNCSL